MKKMTLWLACLFISMGLAIAQDKSVSGTVVDETGDPVIGASVIAKGTALGAVTGVDGKFAFSVPVSVTTLVVKYIGYADREIAAGANIRVALVPDAKMLGEVVVTALGITREKRSLGYDAQEVKSDHLSQAAASNIMGALQGKISGVDITPSSGMPGASVKMTIRGVRSFTGDNTPLYVVDGLPISSTFDMDTGHSVTYSDFTNRALDIDPNDIESVNILKGQAAAALYGMRATNGVVMITTKKGSQTQGKKTVVSLNSNVSFDVISSLPDFQTEFAQGSGGRYNPNSSQSWGCKIVDLPNNPTYGGNTDNTYTKRDGKKEGYYYVPQRANAGLDPWQLPQVYNNAKDFFNTGVTWTNSVNVTSAFEGGSFALSLGSANQEGIIPTTGMDRYNAKFATDLKLDKHWDVGFVGNFVSTSVTKATSANDGIIATIYGTPPSYDFAGIPPHYKDNPTKQNTYRGTQFFDGAYWWLDNNKFGEKTQRFFGNSYANYNTVFANQSKLNIKYLIGIDSYSTDYTDLFGFGHQNQTGALDRYIVTKNELNSLLTASWNKSLTDDLVLDILYGNEVIQSQRRYLDVYTVGGFNWPGWNHLNNASGYGGGETTRNKRTFGNFGNLSLAYRNMLYLNATARYDLVSSMPRGNRGFLYPSASLGWIFTEVDALKNNIVTFGKLRASYAEVGQAGNFIENYYTTPSYGGGFSSGVPISYPIRDVNAFTLYGAVYDPNLRPTTTNTYELGTDLTFLNGLASLNYTFSHQKAKDQIFAVPLAGSTGTSDMIMNAGSIDVKTHEFTLGFNPINKKNIKWDFAFNFTKTDSYVEKLAPGVESIFLGGFVEPQIRASIGYKFPTIYGTDYLRDENGKVIVDEDGLPMGGIETELGTVEPDFRLGFNTSLVLYKFRLSAVLDWKQGGYMYAATNGLLDFYGVSQKSADFRKMDQFLFEEPAVKEDGTPNDIYIDGAFAQAYFTCLNDITASMIKENSFIKVREIALSYPIWDKKNLNVNLNVFARNLILWSTLKGFDPEATQGNNNMAGGFERFSLPGASSFGIGLNVKF